MQTFMPYPDFEQSAKVLDRQRLGCQRKECLQILKALSNPTYGWQNHPVVKMWRGYELLLIEYGLTICKEWTERGYKDTCGDKIAGYVYAEMLNDPELKLNLPWLNDEFCSRHRAALLAKNYEWYSQFGWTEKPEIDYIYPIDKR